MLPLRDLQFKVSSHRLEGVYYGAVSSREVLWTMMFDSTEKLGVKFLYHVVKYMKTRNVTSLNRYFIMFHEWSPRMCPLAASILSGLYRLPASTGDRACVIDGVADTLCHLADIVGPSGHVYGWQSSPTAPPIQLGGMTIPYPNVHVNEPIIGGQLYGPRQRKEIMHELIFGTYSPGHLMKIQNCRESVIETVMQYITAAPLGHSIDCIVVFYPPDQPPISLDTIGDYEQHLIRTLQPIFVLAKSLNTSSYWISIVLKMTDTDSYHETDIICDRIFDILAEFAKPSGTIRPKEQLKIDEKFMRGTIMLSARYRRTPER